MYSGNVSFGFGCPRCKTVTGVQVGGGDRCSDCGSVLMPVPNAPPMHASFVCKRCDSTVGLMIGGTNCPHCNAPIS